MADDEISFRDILKQIATSDGGNRDLVEMAANALRERPLPANPRNQFPLMPQSWQNITRRSAARSPTYSRWRTAIRHGPWTSPNCGTRRKGRRTVIRGPCC
ncbi:MAG: hypothetical protein ACJ8AW_12685 [Rhodopila sp.]